jgi:2-polyprenyl-3-methyl-5-hydroxy-6-metoxy-1,4-benzoquinol methylase
LPDIATEPQQSEVAGRFILTSLGYSRVQDYLRYHEAYPQLMNAKGDLKDVQRPWALEAVRQLVSPGGRILDLGGAACELAATLMNDYDVTVVDPYEGAGNGPRSPDTYRQKYPKITILQGYLDGTTALSDFDAVVSTSVVEHLAVQSHMDIVAGIHQALRPGGYSIHAIDVTVRSNGGFLLMTRDLAQMFINAHGLTLDLHTLCQTMVDDVNTYYLPPLMYLQWKRSRSFAQYPWRNVGSVNVVLQKAFPF